MQAMTQAAQDVLAERQRQIAEEGWDAAHDDEHEGGTGALAKAAAAYAIASTDPRPRTARDDPPAIWPWERHWWKPGRAVDRSADGLGPVTRVPDRRHDLVRAAALLLAEIERMDRASSSASGVDSGDGGKTEEDRG